VTNKSHTATQTILQSGDATLISSLTREDILGDLFHAGGLGYWGQYLALSHLQGLASQTSFDLPNGYGSFGYEPNVTRLFGFPRTLKPGGIAVNVRVSWNNIPQDGDMTKWKGLNLQAGMLTSTLESAVPEQMFNTDPANPIDGISAVKALQLAAQQGQKIYQITPQNQATVLPQLTLSGLAMKEIRQGLAAGKEVIAHASQVSVPGWTGEGYIITDPVTGSGAYKITGGSNGGFILAAAAKILNLITTAWDTLKDNFDNTLDVISFVADVLKKAIVGITADIAEVILIVTNAQAYCPDFWADWITFYAITFALVAAVAGALVTFVSGNLILGAIVTAIIGLVLLDELLGSTLDSKCVVP